MFNEYIFGRSLAFKMLLKEKTRMNMNEIEKVVLITTFQTSMILLAAMNKSFCYHRK